MRRIKSNMYEEIFVFSSGEEYTMRHDTICFTIYDTYLNFDYISNLLPAIEILYIQWKIGAHGNDQFIRKIIKPEGQEPTMISRELLDDVASCVGNKKLEEYISGVEKNILNDESEVVVCERQGWEIWAVQGDAPKSQRIGFYCRLSAAILPKHAVLVTEEAAIHA